MRTRQSVLQSAVTLTLALCLGGGVSGQEDPLSSVKSAYLATEYEAALILLSSTPAGTAPEESEVYRALCLLALGRTREVEQVLQALAARNPSYRMYESEVPPRLIALFADAKRRYTQALITEAYGNAKTAFDAGRYLEASARFGGVLALLDTHGASLDPNESPARDLPQLARGFRDLADAEMAHANALAAAAVNPPTAARPAGGDSAPRAELMIEHVVQRYALAYSALDAGAVVQVFPSENLPLLQAAFRRLKSQAIAPRGITVAIDPAGDAATVSLVWAVQAAPRIGSTIKAESPTTLRMVKSGDGNWLIAERR